MIERSTAQQRQERVSTPVVAAVAVTKAARGMFFVFLTALVAYQFQIAYGLDPDDTQFLVSLASFAGLLRPLLGYWGDVRPLGQHRRKNTMMLGNAIYLASISLLLTFPNPSLSAGYLVVLASCVAYGLGEAFIDVSTDALLLDVATTPAEKSRVQSYARLGAVAGSLGAYGLAIGLIGPGYPWLLATIACTIVAGTALTLRIKEAPVTRGQVLEQIARERPAIPATYKTTLWIAGAAFALTPLAEGITNVQLEPWLISKYGNLPDIFFAVELAAAAISIAVLLAVAASLRCRHWNVSVLIVPGGLVAAAYFVALPWLAPDVAAYGVWVTIHSIAAVTATLGIERTLMDVVKGARKGATFQYFVIFMMAGSFGGQLLGSALGDVVGMEWLLVLSGCIVAAAVAFYALVLAPRLKEAQ